MLGLPVPCGIDPRIDVVFTWLFGDPAHEDLRIDFLNAVLGGDAPRIREARVLNPIHPASMVGERELRVEVEVIDEAGRIFQVEMQRQTRRGLHQRMSYGWARLYAGQVRAAAGYAQLRPVVGIWICEEDAFPASTKAHLQFRVSEQEERLPHHPDLRIDVIQLRRVAAEGTGLPDENLGRWCRFLNEAAQWRSVPAEVYRAELEHAMKAIDTFRTDAERNAIYQARINYQLERTAELEELADAKAEVAEAWAAAAAAQAKLEAALAANEAERTAIEAARAAAEAALVAKDAAVVAKDAALAELEGLRAKVAERPR